MSQYNVRWMIRRDIPEVLAIEQSTSHPWVEDQFLVALSQRNCIGMVIEKEDKVLGFMLYELHKSKLELTRFVVAHGARRKGVGAQMLGRLASKLSSHKRTRIGVSISEHREDMQMFLKFLGWHAVRVDRGAGEDGEDCYRFTYHVSAKLTAEEEREYAETGVNTEE